MRLNQADSFLWEIWIEANGNRGVAGKFLVKAQNKTQAEFKLQEKAFYQEWAKGRGLCKILITKRYRALGTIPKEGILA